MDISNLTTETLTAERKPRLPFHIEDEVRETRDRLGWSSTWQVVKTNPQPQWRKYVMATNKPIGDSARKGAVKKRSQLATKTMGKKTFTKRNKEGGQFMAQKKKSKFKGVRKER
jgi:hypothetical protein